MFSHSEQTANDATQHPADQVVTLLKQKYPNLSVTCNPSKTPSCVDVVFLNTVPNVSGDETNSKPLQYLKLRLATISKKPHEQHSYWDYSVATIEKSRLNDVIAGLEVMPDCDHKHAPDRMMARC